MSEPKTPKAPEAPKKPEPRSITSHQVNPCNEDLQIDVLDEPGAGGACHHYRIGIFNDGHSIDEDLHIKFQNGPIKEAGVNGITQQALIAICIDRLECFQAGPYACKENGVALNRLKDAQSWLLKRTRARMARGVEGTHEK
jgi:hypothetical protein